MAGAELSPGPRPPPPGRGGSGDAAGREHAASTPGVLSPWAILGGFAGVAALGLAGAPAVAAAAALLLFVGAVTIRHPANGLAALVLAIPFLLGEPKTVYFLLEPLLVALVLLGFLGIADLVHDAPRGAVDPEANPVQVAPAKLPAAGRTRNVPQGQDDAAQRDEGGPSQLAQGARDRRRQDDPVGHRSGSVW